MLVFFLILTYVRWHSIIQANKLIEKDEVSYNVFWKKLKVEEGVNGGALEASLEPLIGEWTRWIEDVAEVKEWNDRVEKQGWKRGKLSAKVN